MMAVQCCYLDLFHQKHTTNLFNHEMFYLYLIYDAFVISFVVRFPLFLLFKVRCYF